MRQDKTIVPLNNNFPIFLLYMNVNKCAVVQAQSHIGKVLANKFAAGHNLFKKPNFII